MFWERYNDLCLKKGESPNAVAKKLEISSGTVTGWKEGREPRNSTLLKIAEYFETSAEYLIGKTGDPAPQQKEAPENGGIDYSNLSPEHIEFIRTVSELSVEELRNLKQIIDFVKSQRQ